MPAWLIPLIQAAIQAASQYEQASAEQRAELDARASAAMGTMNGDRTATLAAHDARTAATRAAIEGGGTPPAAPPAPAGSQ